VLGESCQSPTLFHACKSIQYAAAKRLAWHGLHQLLESTLTVIARCTLPCMYKTLFKLATSASLHFASFLLYLPMRVYAVRVVLIELLSQIPAPSADALVPTVWVCNVPSRCIALRLPGHWGWQPFDGKPCQYKLVGRSN